MTQTLTVRRWSRFGADRLVVTADTGARIGWIDLRSGEVVVERPRLEGSMRRAAQEYLRADVTELALRVRRGAREAPGSLDAPDVPVIASGAHTIGAERGGSVGARLSRLGPEGWLVLHDVPVGRQGGVLDHLLIGPGGVYTIREHDHPARDVRVSRTHIDVAGRPTHYLRDANLERRRVQQLLGAAAGVRLEVCAVIVLDSLGLAAPAASSTPDAALVLARTDIPGVFRRLPRRLAATRVEAIRAAAGRRATWTS